MIEFVHKPDKIYYTIGEAADIFQVNISLIRFWENEFKILKPRRNKKGNRLFTPKDMDHLHLIYYLVKECGMTLEGAKKRMENQSDELSRKFEVIKKLKSIKSKLGDLQQAIEVIENKEVSSSQNE